MEKGLRYSSDIEVIAEIANTHQGDPNYAYELASKIILYGADSVKFQIYFADELLSKNHPRYKHFQKQSFKESVWFDILKSLKKKNVKIYADIFGEKAYAVAKNCNLDGYKIHSSDLNNIFLINSISEKNKKYFLSSGGSTIREINSSIQLFEKKKIKPILMHGFQAYPTKLEDNNLRRIIFFKKTFSERCEFGFQDHTFGGSKFSTIIPQIAVDLGAKYIEKHVILKRSSDRVDYHSSLEPEEFQKFIQTLKLRKKYFLNNLKKNKIIGKKDFLFSNAEINYRNKFKKIWFINKKITKGSIIKKKNLIMRRSNNSKINSTNIDAYINKKVIKNIKANSPINKLIIRNKIVALLVVRLASKRLKHKALKKICNFSTIEHLILRLKRSKKIDKIIICTSKKKENRVFKEISTKHRVGIFFGNDKDVLDRMIQATKNKNYNLVIRVTGDDILVDPIYLDKNINFHLKNNLEYSNNKKLPSGMEVEIFDKNLLTEIKKIAVDTSGTEYLTFYINDNIQQIHSDSMNLKNDYRKIRMTLDNSNDFFIIKKFLEEMNSKRKLFNYKLNDVINFYKKNKQLFKQKKNIKIKGTKIDTRFNWQELN